MVLTSIDSYSDYNTTGACLNNAFYKMCHPFNFQNYAAIIMCRRTFVLYTYLNIPKCIIRTFNLLDFYIH